MRKTAVLLDAGGVLLDETEMEQILCGIAVELVRTIRSDYTESDYWTDVEEPVVCFAPATRPYVIWKHCRGDLELFTRLNSEFHARQKSAVIPMVLMDGIVDELKSLATRFKLLLAGQYGPRVYGLLAKHGVEELFANRLSQHDFNITKPDPRYIQQIAERSGLNPAECIMVGDRIDNDVIPAKQNGMGSVMVRTGIYKRQMPRVGDEVPDIDLPGVKGLAGAVMGEWGGE